MSARSASDSRSSRSSSASSSRRSRSALLLTPPLNLTLYGSPAPRATRPPVQQQQQRRMRHRRASADLRARSPPPAPRSSPALGPAPAPSPTPASPGPSLAAPFRFPLRDSYSPFAQGDKPKGCYERRRSSNSSTPDYFGCYSPMRVLPSATPELEDDEKSLLGYSTKRETYYCDITDRKEQSALPTSPLCSSPFQRESAPLSYVSKNIYDYTPTNVKYVRGHSAIPTCHSSSHENYDGYLLSRTKSLPSVNNFATCLSFKQDSYKGFNTEDYRSNCSDQTKNYPSSSDVHKYNTEVIDTHVEINGVSEYKNWSYDTDTKVISHPASNLYNLELQSENYDKSVVNNTTENDMLCLTEIQENFTNHCASPLNENDTATKSQTSLLFPDKISTDESEKKTYNPSNYNEYDNTPLTRNSNKDSQAKNTSSHHVRFDVDACEGLNNNDRVASSDLDDKIYERDYEMQFRKLNIPPDQDNMVKTSDNYFKDLKFSPSKESTTDNASCSSVDNACNSGLYVISDHIEKDNFVSTSILVVGSRGDVLLKNFNEDCLLEKGTMDNVSSFSNTPNKMYSALHEVSVLQGKNSSDISSNSSVRDNHLKNSESESSLVTKEIIRTKYEDKSSFLSSSKYNSINDANKYDSSAKNVANLKELTATLDKGKTEIDHNSSTNYDYSTTSKVLLCENDFSDVSSFQGCNKYEFSKKSTNENNVAVGTSNHTSHIQREMIHSPSVPEETLQQNPILKSEIADGEKNSPFSVLDTKYRDSFSEQGKKLTNTYDKDNSLSPVNSTNSKFTRVQCNHSNPPSPDLKLSLRELKDAAHYARQLATVLENIIQKHSQPKCSSKECTSQQFEASYLSDVTWEEYSDEEWASQGKHSSVLLENIPDCLNTNPHTVSNDRENKEQKEIKKHINGIRSPPQEFAVGNRNYEQSRYQVVLPQKANDCSYPSNSEAKLFSCYEHTHKMFPAEIDKKESNDFQKSSLERTNSSKYLLNSCSSPSSDRCHCCGPTMLHLSPEMLRQQRASLKVPSKDQDEKKKNASTSLHQEVTDAIRNAIQLRREAILPSDDTTCATSRSMSEWSI